MSAAKEGLQPKQDSSGSCFHFKKLQSSRGYSVLPELQLKVASEPSLIVDGTVLIDDDAVPMQALMDTGAEVNVISQHFVIEHQLTRMDVPLPQPQFLDGQKTYCFGAYKVRY